MDSFERNSICMKYGKPSLDLLTNELEVLNETFLFEEVNDAQLHIRSWDENVVFAHRDRITHTRE